MSRFSHLKTIGAVASIAPIVFLAQLAAGARATEQCPPGVTPPSPYCRNVLPVGRTGAASAIRATRATLHGTAGPGVAGGDLTHYRFQYGTTKRYGSTSSTGTVRRGPASVGVKLLIDKLQPGTRYHYRIVAADSDGTTDGADRTFRTACHAPTGQIDGLSVGPLRLGMTIKQAQAVLPVHHSMARGWEDFCLTPSPGIRVNFPSRKLLSELSPSERAAVTGKIDVALTANKHYAVKDVTHGTKLAVAISKLGLGPVDVVGLNDWYLAPDGPADVIVKVRHGTVLEIGLANKQLSASPQAFLTSVG